MRIRLVATLAVAVAIAGGVSALTSTVNMAAGAHSSTSSDNAPVLASAKHR
jgi:hypothetical protein